MDNAQGSRTGKIPHFRQWVDEGRRKRTAAATAVSNKKALPEAHIEAEANAVGESLPQRYSKRRNLGTVIRSAVSCVGTFVTLALSASVAPMTRADYNTACSVRSSALQSTMWPRRADPLACRLHILCDGTVAYVTAYTSGDGQADRVGENRVKIALNGGEASFSARCARNDIKVLPRRQKINFS